MTLWRSMYEQRKRNNRAIAIKRMEHVWKYLLRVWCSQADGVQHGGVDGGGGTVDDEVVAADEGGLVGRQEQRRLRHVLRPQHLPAQDVVRHRHGLQLLWPDAHERAAHGRGHATGGHA